MDQPTFVLVHGGATTARFWDRLVPLLSPRPLAIDLPGRGAKPADPMTFTVQDGVDSILADIAAANLDDVVLVAHSSGGLFVPATAAALGPRVKRIVLSSASVPPEGGVGLDAMQPKHKARVVEAMDAARRDGWVLTTPGPPADPEAMRAGYGGDPLDDETLAFVVDPVRAVKDSMNFYFQPVSWASVPVSVPITYVKALRDRAVPPDLQDAMIARLPRADVCEIDSGHAPCITHPREFAAILTRLC